MGRKAYAPDEKDIKMVTHLAKLGLRDSDIASGLDIAESTLQKYFANFLAKGRVIALQKVADTLFTLATNGKNLAATIFYLKCRGGWLENPKDEEDDSLDVKKMTTDQLRAHQKKAKRHRN
jgi:hypothetical protein